MTRPDPTWGQVVFSWPDPTRVGLWYRDDASDFVFVSDNFFIDDIPVTITNETSYCLIDLKPNTNYHVKIQYITDEGESVISDPTVFHTDDECNKILIDMKFVFFFGLVPPAIINLHVARTTMTAIRLAWESPDLRGCNVLKGYQVYLSKIDLFY